jgi:hypothetical protein
MIGFIGTSLQLQSIITTHTLNSFWMTCLTNLSRLKNLLDWTNFHADRIEITISNSSSVILCYPLQRKLVSRYIAHWLPLLLQSGFQAVFTEPLPSNGVFRYNTIWEIYHAKFCGVTEKKVKSSMITFSGEETTFDVYGGMNLTQHFFISLNGKSCT